MGADGRLRSAQSSKCNRLECHPETRLGEYGILVDGEWLKNGDAIEVHSPYDDSLVAIAASGRDPTKLRPR